MLKARRLYGTSFSRFSLPLTSDTHFGHARRDAATLFLFHSRELYRRGLRASRSLLIISRRAEYRQDLIMLLLGLIADGAVSLGAAAEITGILSPRMLKGFSRAADTLRFTPMLLTSPLLAAAAAGECRLLSPMRARRIAFRASRLSVIFAAHTFHLLVERKYATYDISPSFLRHLLSLHFEDI